MSCVLNAHNLCFKIAKMVAHARTASHPLVTPPPPPSFMPPIICKICMYINVYCSKDRAERHDFWSRFFLFIIIFFFTFFLGGKRKGEKSHGQNSCLSARSFKATIYVFLRKFLMLFWNFLYYFYTWFFKLLRMFLFSRKVLYCV